MQTEPHTKDTFLRDIILGGQDGLVNVLGIILGVSVASGDTRLIIVAGLAATFAESVSMAAVAYTSEMARHDHYLSERKREEREVEEVPDVEREEIREIYRQKGFRDALLEEIVKKITSDKAVWIETMMKEELNLAPVNKTDALRTAILVGVSALVGSLIPLAPFFLFPVSAGISLSLIVSALALFLTGFYKARVTVGRPFKSGIELLVIGMTAALIGFVIGTLFKP